MNPAVELRGACKSYTRPAEVVRALDDVTLACHAGDLVCLRGPSGSGKSTLLKAIAGLLRLDSGEVLVDGKNLADLPVQQLTELRRDSIGVVFQHQVMVDEFTAAENVALPLEASGLTPDEARRLALSALARVGVDELADSLPHAMSGGQLQRVGIARALAGGQHILVADEPTASLDSANARAVYEQLRMLADKGCVVVLATHDDRAMDYATRTITIVDGHLGDS